jgi:hypothetical protein
MHATCRSAADAARSLGSSTHGRHEADPRHGDPIWLESRAQYIVEDQARTAKRFAVRYRARR